jgi:hypothetical protein
LHDTSTKFTRIRAIDAGSFEVQVGELLAALTVSHDRAVPSLDLRTWTFGFMNNTSIVACGLSHAKAIAVAYAMGLQEALIIEDDVSMSTIQEVAHNAELIWSILEQMVSSLPAGWQILQLSPLVINPEKAAAMHNDLMRDQRMWSKRCSCAGDDYMAWGAGAYMISRDGMRAFLETYLPQYLHASIIEAEAFSGLFDFQDTFTSLTADVWVYELPEVYVTHLPLLAPTEAVAQHSTRVSKSRFYHATMPTTQREAFHVALSALASNGFFNNLARNDLIQNALNQTRSMHNEHKQDHTRTTSGPRYALLLDLGMHTAALTATNVTDTHDWVVDVSTAAQRLRLHLLLEQLNVWQARFWTTMVNSYFRRCHFDLRPTKIVSCVSSDKPEDWSSYCASVR